LCAAAAAAGERFLSQNWAARSLRVLCAYVAAAW
jgi:hypothetical protein